MKRRNVGLSVGFLFDDTLDSTDGVAQHVKTLGAWLSSAGHEVSYLVGETSIDSWASGTVYSLARNIGVTFNGNKLSMPLVSHKADLRRVLQERNFDVLHVMVPYSPFLSHRLINLAPPNTTVIGTFHIFPAGFLSRAGASLLRGVNARSLKRISSMISVSGPAAEFCRQSLKRESVIFPNPVNVAAYKPDGRLLSGPKKVVFLGRLVKRKGCEQLIRAFSILDNDSPDIQLVIAGDGPQRLELERLAQKLGIKNKTSFLGHIAEQDKPNLLHGADVACFPSLYGESFGIVLVEAMAAGAKTILGGDNPGYRSVLNEQPNCLVNPSDIEALSSRLKLLLSDKALSRKISKWQRQTVRQYDIEVVGPKIESLYRTEIARLTKKSHNTRYEQ